MWGFYFRETFVKLKPSRNKSLSFTDIGKSCPSREYLTWQVCLLTLFAKLEMFEFTVMEGAECI